MFDKNSINLICIISLLFVSTELFSQYTLQGIWNSGKDNTMIEVTESNGTIVGKIKSSDKKDIELGKVILKDLKKEDNTWVGSIYAHQRKEWYDVEISPQDNVLQLKVSVGFLSKTLIWKKTKG
ncbi:hypothetical protein GCM10022393_23640 [Aquimarina addita]|uniref:DUF2147 domain-containing protein n=1 Tax=Aquimarina addita TaxID=870485 RepID=A0ABP6UM91_9FLAO